MMSLGCGIMTSSARRVWRNVSPQVVAAGWIRCGSAMEAILRLDPRVSSRLWLTDKPADAHEEEILRKG
jgi:hypothetical protein